MSLEEEIIKEVESHEKTKDGWYWGMIGTVGTTLIFVHRPAAIGFGVFCALAEAVSEKRSLKKKPMPDSWMQRVSESENVSKEGLSFLTIKISEKGFVSVSDALAFIEIENKIQTGEEITIKKEHNNTGAESLLKRALNECRDTLDKDTISAGFNKIKSSMDFTDNMQNTGKLIRNYLNKNKK